MKIRILADGLSQEETGLALALGVQAHKRKRRIVLEHDGATYVVLPEKFGAKVIVKVPATVVLSASNPFSASRLHYANGTLSPASGYLDAVGFSATPATFAGTYKRGTSGREVIDANAVSFSSTDATVPTDSGETNQFGAILGVSGTADRFTVVYTIVRYDWQVTKAAASIADLDRSVAPYVMVEHYVREDDDWTRVAQLQVTVPTPASQFAGSIATHGQVVLLNGAAPATDTPADIYSRHAGYTNLALSFNDAGSLGCGLVNLVSSFGARNWDKYTDSEPLIERSMDWDILLSQPSLVYVKNYARWIERATYRLDIEVDIAEDGAVTLDADFTALDAYEADAVETGGRVELEIYNAKGSSRFGWRPMLEDDTDFDWYSFVQV